MTEHPVARSRTLRAIATIEAVKGVLVLAASVGFLSVVHHDVRHLIVNAINHFGINSNARYPMVLLHYADVLQNANLRSLVLLALGYASLRLIEAYGLWRDLAWGEWLGALSGAIYIPFEVRHFLHRPSAIGAAVFLINVLIVGFLAFRLYRRRAAGLHSLP